MWIFHCRKINSNINKIQKNVLRIVHKEKDSDFSGLLARDNTFTVLEKNLQMLAIEIYKFYNNVSPGFINKIFTGRTHPYNIRNHTKTYKLLM